MDAEEASALTRLKRLILWPIIGLLSVTTLYFLAAWAGSSIPRNSQWSEPGQGVEIMIETNGVHTAIVMPLVTAQKDWRPDFPEEIWVIRIATIPTSLLAGGSANSTSIPRNGAI